MAGVTPSKMQSYKLPLNDQEKPLPIIILFRNLNFILKLIHVICYFENKQSLSRNYAVFILYFSFIGIEMPIQLDISGAPLPSAREISTLIHRQGDVMDMNAVLTVMVMQWGQFLEHDILSIPVNRGTWTD